MARNKATRQAYQRKWARENPEKIRASRQKWEAEHFERARARRKKRYRRHYGWIVRTFKNNPCIDCGKRYPAPQMHFDHVRGRKLFNVAKGWCQSAARIIAEIQKCELRCRWCHVKRHAAERKNTNQRRLAA